VAYFQQNASCFREIFKENIPNTVKKPFGEKCGFIGSKRMFYLNDLVTSAMLNDWKGHQI